MLKDKTTLKERQERSKFKDEKWLKQLDQMECEDENRLKEAHKNKTEIQMECAINRMRVLQRKADEKLDNWEVIEEVKPLSGGWSTIGTGPEKITFETFTGTDDKLNETISVLNKIIKIFNNLKP